MVKQSNELLYPGALIVMTRDSSGDENNAIYKVFRYWQEVHKTSVDWIQQKHIFSLKTGPYEDLFVFDEFAIVLKNEGKLISAIYFDMNREDKIVPPHMERDLYNEL